MMNMRRSILASVVFALSAGIAGVAAAAENINLVYNGKAVANSRPVPTDPAFQAWCNASGAALCVPTVEQPVYNTDTGKKEGMVYVWGAFPFNSTSAFPSALCFSEFIVFALEAGELTVHTEKNGTCGATMDPAIKKPLAAYPDASVVVAGGGDGVISGGTGKYKKWTGTFTDRVFVGFGNAGVNGIIYYDQLIFSISRK